MNLKEEIKRIKSLFTEERLYGNLINERAENPDTNGDKIIDKTEFKNSDYEITPEEAMEFLDASSDKKILRAEDCDSVIQNTPHLKCVQEAFNYSSWAGREQIFKQSVSVGCTIQMTRVNAFFEILPLTNAVFSGQSSYSASNTLSTLTFWQFGRYKGLQKTFALLMEFKTPISKAFYKEKGVLKSVEGVNFIRLRGGIDDSCNVTNLYVDQIDHKDGINNLSDFEFGTFTEVDTVEKLLDKIKQ